MALTLIPFPNSAPVDLTDWSKAVDIMELNSLGTFGANPYDFSSDTIKQGVIIMIGGSLYLADSDTAITGTASDYVQITPSGSTASAAYVSSLTGVSWNSVWNHYEDVSGNAYIFNERKAKAGGTLTTPRSKLAHDWEYGFYSELVTTGNTILARDGGNVVVGISSPPLGSKVHFREPTELGGTAGDSQILLTNHFEVGNNLYQSIWSVRDTNGTTFTTAALHDALSVDSSFQTPRTNTKTWWERNPSAGTHAWGNENTTGMMLFPGGDVGIGNFNNPGPRLVVADGVGSLPSISGSVVGLFQNNAATSTNAAISILSGNTGASYIFFSDSDSVTPGQILYDHTNNRFDILTSGTQAMRITSANHLLVNTTSDVGVAGHFDGGFRVTGSSAYWELSPSGRTLVHNFAGINYLYANNASGAFAFVTGARVISDPNANLLLNADQSVTVNTTLLVDTIEEKTASAGVTIGSTLKVDTIEEETASAGVTVGSILKVDTIQEKTASAGVTFSNPIIPSSGIREASGSNLKMKVVSTSGTGTVFTVAHGLTQANIRGVAVQWSGSQNIVSQGVPGTSVRATISASASGTMYWTIFYV